MLNTTSLSEPTPLSALDHSVLLWTIRPLKMVSILLHSCKDLSVVMCSVSSISVAPNAPPDNVQALTVSSTAILVTWDPVPEISRNGIITQYEIEVNQSTFDEIPSTRLTTTNGSVLMVELRGLEEYVEYTIRVRAYTSEGPGPFSVARVNRTLEEGEWSGVKSNFNSAALNTMFWEHLGVQCRPDFIYNMTKAQMNSFSVEICVGMIKRRITK